MRIRPLRPFGPLPVVVALALLSALLLPPAARAQSDGADHEILRNASSVGKGLAGRGERLRTSAGPDPDTVYVGKSSTNHTAPDNYWNIYTGSYLPGINAATNALWDWDNTAGPHAADSLQGWGPPRGQNNSTGGLPPQGQFESGRGRAPCQHARHRSGAPAAA